MSQGVEVVYEDVDLLVINKPPGLVVDRDKGLPGLEGCFIVHRLDKDTSGILVMAKNLESFENLKSQFKKRQVRKGYLALVHGKVESPSGTIAEPVGRNPRETKKFTVIEGGRQAVTKYKVVKYVVAGHAPPKPTGDACVATTLLELEPLTGRTHQIRVHLKSLGHPIVGDKLYASRRQQKEDTQITKRQFLHAYRLGFTHPRTGEWMRFEVDLPEDLENILKELKERRTG